MYSDYKESAQDQSIDIIHVLTPNDSHAEISIASLEAGKHVMCEKPMAKRRGCQADDGNREAHRQEIDDRIQ